MKSRKKAAFISFFKSPEKCDVAFIEERGRGWRVEGDADPFIFHIMNVMYIYAERESRGGGHLIPSAYFNMGLCK